MSANTARQSILSGAMLGVFALVGSAVLAFTYLQTHDRIQTNEQAMLRDQLHVLLPPTRHDNDLISDTLTVTDRAFSASGKPVTVYRARQGGKPVAVIAQVTAPDGYSGAIDLLVAINTDGSLIGVRVTRHKETPGLGDYIEIERSDWIRVFENKRLGDPPVEKWKVKKDSGTFDYVAGATVTPRAIVKAVRKALEYFSAHREELLAAQ